MAPGESEFDTPGLEVRIDKPRNAKAASDRKKPGERHGFSLRASRRNQPCHHLILDFSSPEL